MKNNRLREEVRRKKEICQDGGSRKRNTESDQIQVDG